VRGVGLVGLRGPVVADRSAIGLKRERARDLGRLSIRRLQGSGAFGNPVGPGRFDFKFLAADGSAIEKYIEFSFVGGEDGARRGFLVGSVRGEAGHNREG